MSSYVEGIPRDQNVEPPNLQIQEKDIMPEITESKKAGLFSSIEG